MNPTPIFVAPPSTLTAVSEHNGHASTDLNFTRVSGLQGQGVTAHVNHEVDVLIVALEGSGVVTIDEVAFALSSGAALLIPKGSTRAVQSTSEQFVYFSIHRRRAGLLQIETRNRETMD